MTEKPTLELGEADNTPATVWWHHTGDDGGRPYNQIVSHAVREYQNIGNHCVWMHADGSKAGTDRFNTERAFLNRLDDMPADVRKRLAPLIPAEWTTIQADERAEIAKTSDFQQREEDRAAAYAEAQAWAAEKNPPSDRDLGLLRAYRLGIVDDTIPSLVEVMEYSLLPEDEQESWLAGAGLTPEKEEALRYGIPEPMTSAVERLENDPRAAQVSARAQKLLPDIRQRLAAAAQAAIPRDDLHEWHFYCAGLKVSDRAVRLGDGPETSQDRRIMTALDAYAKAAAKEGIVPPVIAADSTTRMYGSGASNYEGSTYGWTYDGTHIYAADSRTIPSQQTYWTDAGGYLVGRPKGGPGQSWSITAWTPTPEPDTNLGAVTLTGLFGPLNKFLGPLGQIF